VDGRLVELQGTAERRSFARAELDALLDLALAGIGALGERQRAALAERLAAVEELRARGPRRQTPPRSERELWGPPKKT
jgi:hypothetical protein